MTPRRSRSGAGRRRAPHATAEAEGDPRARARTARVGGAAAARSAASLPLTNAQIAELLAVDAENVEGHVRRAMRRASRYAFLWPREAAEVARSGGSLTELPGIGPFLARRIGAWIEEPPWVADAHPLRRDFLTLTEARRILAEGEPAELRGDLQMHTTWSDGAGSVAEMAAAGVERGYAYVAITDHSKALKIARGLDEAALAEQGREIARVNATLEEAGAELRVLRSIEMNLTPEGAGDLEREALAGLDLVLGSFHSALRRTEDQTARYLAALRHPELHVLGHPRGRVYDHRLGLRADWRAVFGTAAELDKAVELDAYPDRQDLNLELLEEARAAGCRISVGTDAHAPWQLGFAEFGLAALERAGVPPERVVNRMEREELVRWVESLRLGKRRRARAPGGGGGI